MTKSAQNFSRYLPADNQTHNWGWRLQDVGRQVIQPGSPYPAPGHPFAYLFDNNGKRTLNEFQIVYVTDGSGTFESASVKERSVAAGDCLLTFPGEWHRYSPKPETGWSEYWLGFTGQDAKRVMANFFNRRQPVLQPAQSNEILKLFEQLLFWIRQSDTAADQIRASHVPMILAFLQTRSPDKNWGRGENTRLVMEAKALILNNTTGQIDLQKLSASLGVSYSKFRSVFKSQTGYSPREYVNRIKLNRACELIQSGQHSISRISDILGFSSVYYFSRAFKNQFGHSPRDWAKRTVST